MYLLTANLIVNKNIGDLNQEKINNLKKHFSFFPEFITNNPQQITIRSANEGITIDSLSNVVVYFYNGDYDTLNYDSATEHVKNVLNIINLDTFGYLNIQFEGTEFKDGDTHKASIDAFDEFAFLNEDIKGIGLRLLLKDNVFSGEVKVEPYVKDSNRIFYQGVSASIDALNLEENMFENEMKKLVDFCNDVSDKIY